MKHFGLKKLEKESQEHNLLLRIQVRRPFGIWTLRLVVAEQIGPRKIQIWGEMKAWAYNGFKGLQLDTMKVSSLAPSGVGHLVWSATMAWALEETPCREARLLAIFDENEQNARLKKYFSRRGFKVVREVGSSPMDLPLRMVWGGAGSLMIGKCEKIFDQSYSLWKVARELN